MSTANPEQYIEIKHFKGMCKSLRNQVVALSMALDSDRLFLSYWFIVLSLIYSFGLNIKRFTLFPDEEAQACVWQLSV